LARYWADSTGRRNALIVDLCQALVKRFRWRFPVESFARPGIQGGGDGGDCVWAMRAEIRSLWKVLAQ
jgi:hypothetical protein